jgi:transcriptional regulator with XRE-family HTH domain
VIVTARPPSRAVTLAALDIGQQLTAWRKLLGLTTQQVAERTGLARATVGRVEHGDLGVNWGAFLRVAHALGVLNAVVTATDPYETDFGRARADLQLPQRVRS